MQKITKKQAYPWLLLAVEQAKKSLSEGGIPIGSVLVRPNGEVIARGHNQRVQHNDPTAHAETQCIRAAGRRRDWNELILVSTLSPCAMCTGTSLLFQIPLVVIGENETFMGEEDWFEHKGTKLLNLDDEECKSLMRDFISKHPDLWNEDIGL
ncbi:MAG: nucleoside deaminase [Bdellovibrionales bacterium]|nr:nucleoside deaminase [Bdellovibrionales bacterium]